MHMLTLKQGLHLSKVHSEMKTFMNKSKETAPNWSFILMLLMTIDKVSESGWICVDQRLNLVFESRAILYGMPQTPPWFSHLALTSYLFRYGGLLGLARMTEIP